MPSGRVLLRLSKALGTWEDHQEPRNTRDFFFFWAWRVPAPGGLEPSRGRGRAPACL